MWSTKKNKSPKTYLQLVFQGSFEFGYSLLNQANLNLLSVVTLYTLGSTVVCLGYLIKVEI